VSHQNLNGAQIRAGLQQMSGEAVTQGMRSDVFPLSYALDRRRQRLTHRLLGDAARRGLPGEQLRTLRLVRIPVQTQEAIQPPAEHHEAVFVALAVVNMDYVTGLIDVGGLQRAGHSR